MRTPDPIEIGGHRVGPGERPFVIAEVSGNHNGSLDRALEIVDAIAGTGAQAVKFQTYRADTITIDADGPRLSGRLTTGTGEAIPNATVLLESRVAGADWQPVAAVPVRDGRVAYEAAPEAELWAAAQPALAPYLGPTLELIAALRHAQARRLAARS